MDKGWVEILAKAASGKPGAIKDRLLSEDKSQRYKQVAEVIAEIDRLYAKPARRSDGWLNRIDGKSQNLPGSALHDIHWNKSAEVQVGMYELHISAKRDG